MYQPKELKKIVREKYGQIADQSPEVKAKSCCGGDGCTGVDYAMLSEDYSRLQGYLEDADLGLGCGVPTAFAQMKPGDTVVDLGSGAGNDVFVARAVVGEKGRVIGVDMTEAMITRARANGEKHGFKNVEFRLGEIEKLPVSSNTADVVISNCVLNLVPDKEKAFGEIFRVLKTGGRFSISDIVTSGNLPEQILKASEMYAGCVAGALKKSDYLSLIQKAGFENIRVVKEKPVPIPDETLLRYLNRAELDHYRASNNGLLSITVYAEKMQGDSN
jgi:SAM-dependent methyltransferase